MKTSLKQNDFDRPTLKNGIEKTKSINRRKISRAIFLDRSPTVLRGGGGRFKYLSGEVLKRGRIPWDEFGIYIFVRFGKRRIWNQSIWDEFIRDQYGPSRGPPGRIVTVYVPALIQALTEGRKL